MMEVFHILIYVFFGLAAFCLALSVMEYFLFKIPDVRAELTGKKARRAIKKMGSEDKDRATPIGRGLTGTLKQTESLTSGSLDDAVMMTGNLPKGKNSSSLSGRTAQGASSSLSAKKTAPTAASAAGLKITKDILIIHTEERIKL